MKSEFEHKFNMGQTVFSINSSILDVISRSCSRYSCEDFSELFSGYVKNIECSNRKIINEHKIKAIYAYIKDEIQISYEMTNYHFAQIPEENLFSTKQEAIDFLKDKVKQRINEYLKEYQKIEQEIEYTIDKCLE